MRQLLYLGMSQTKISRWDSWYLRVTHKIKLKRLFTYLCTSQIKKPSVRPVDVCKYACHKTKSLKRRLIHNALHIRKHPTETVDASVHVTHQNTSFRQLYLCISCIRHVNETVDIYANRSKTRHWRSWYNDACHPPERSMIQLIYLCMLHTKARFQENVYLLSYHAIVTAPKHSPKRKIQQTCNCNRVPCSSGASRGVWGGSTPTPPKFRNFNKAEPNSQFLGKYIQNNLIRIRISLIWKLSGTPD
jgi:hypothetical protein